MIDVVLVHLDSSLHVIIRRKNEKVKSSPSTRTEHPLSLIHHLRRPYDASMYHQSLGIEPSLKPSCCVVPGAFCS